MGIDSYQLDTQHVHSSVGLQGPESAALPRWLVWLNLPREGAFPPGQREGCSTQSQLCESSRLPRSDVERAYVKSGAWCCRQMDSLNSHLVLEGGVMLSGCSSASHLLSLHACLSSWLTESSSVSLGL